jgi:DNA mismatch repair protein MutS2
LLADVASATQRVAASGVLAGGEIRDIGKTLDAARTLRRFLTARRARIPTLFEACATDPSLDRLAEELAAAFDPDGLLSDRASPRLKELRGEYSAARTRLLSRLDDVMDRYESILQERYVTEREGRYVIPVRSDAHERFPGIVHASSASGATLFVEPRAVIPMGNRLKVLEADVQREELAIYADLSSRIGEAIGSVAAAASALARADVRAATARLATDLQLSFPPLTEEPRLTLLAARHPLLLLDAARSAPSRAGSTAEGSKRGPATIAQSAVIPSDLSVSAKRAIVVSGPNAGGKTVALKTMGLTALMTRAGLPVACADSSEVGIFDIVLTDVGDDQNITKNLSTFSAHIRNLVQILEDTQSGALVLLDELAGGTDPREGEALAAGMLDSLTARGGAVVVTTHYEGLKALALADPRFENASMGFNLASMSPTFRLAQGVPGSSSALAVARTFGMPSTVIERAERFLSREDVHFESVVKKLNDERAAVELARTAAERRENEANTLRLELERELRQQRDRDLRQVSKEAEALFSAVRRAREELREVQLRLREKKLDAAAAQETSKLLDRVAAKVALGGELEPLLGGGRAADPSEYAERAPKEGLKKGVRVWVARLRAEADVLDVQGDGSVRVQAGAMRLVVPAGELSLVNSAPQDASADPKKKTQKALAGTVAPRGSEPAGLERPLQTEDNTCDLRGMRSDDALSLAIGFLDRALNADVRVCFLVHGHGTGALREAIRRELTTSPYVRFFRPGSNTEGGDGATIVWLS